MRDKEKKQSATVSQGVTKTGDSATPIASSQITGLSTPEKSLGIHERIQVSQYHVKPVSPPVKWRGGESSWDNKELAEERR